MKYKNQVAVVTGAGGTLCSVIAKKLAAEGAKVALIGRTEATLRAVADEITADGGIARVCPADVTDEAAITEAAAMIKAELGPCRYLINGAGGNNNNAVTTRETFLPDELTEHEGRGFFDLDAAVMSSVININTMGTLIPSRIFGRQMAEAGCGAILNFASMNSYKPLTKVPAYAMSKAAIVNFTEWLAAYLAPAGIRVNAVAPGFFVNERSKKILMTPDGGLTQRGLNVQAHTPMARFGEAAELWGCVDWLLDDERAGFVTGITVPVDGGFSAHPGI
ncbi:MAG: SDR family NAD(P)-dependent oxidoreductase [Ruminococcaceae bacterium]|nr:SDR family NAD(P)-dependent oxidoreductase [Oscillospiraceae bacterium]